jgi:hypothetical protein
MDRNENGMDLSLTFLGLGVYDDYILRLSTGKEDRGSLIVEGKYGTRADYDLTFVEKPAVASQVGEVKNLVVAGFDSAIKSETLGWLNIGQSPVGSSLAIEESFVPEFASSGENLAEIVSKKELEQRKALGLEAEDMSDGTATAAPAVEEGSAPVPVEPETAPPAAGTGETSAAPPAAAPPGS